MYRYTYVRTYIYLTVYRRICERASDKIFYATFLANYFTFSMAHGWCVEIARALALALKICQLMSPVVRELTHDNISLPSLEGEN